MLKVFILEFTNIKQKKEGETHFFFKKGVNFIKDYEDTVFLAV